MGTTVKEITGQIQFNITKRTEAIKYIVVHETDNTDKGSNATMHFNYFNGGDRQSSCDYAVDDGVIYKLNDYNKYYSWHAGKPLQGVTINNKNSIGIEICVNSDGDYNKAVKNAQYLISKLLKELNLPINAVVRHKDVSGKMCPRNLLNKWGDFKEGILNYGKTNPVLDKIIQIEQLLTEIKKEL